MPFPQPKHDEVWKKHGSISFGVIRESQAVGEKVAGGGDEIFRLGRETECPGCQSLLFQRY